MFAGRTKGGGTEVDGGKKLPGLAMLEEKKEG